MPPGCPIMSVEDVEQRPGHPGGEQRARGLPPTRSWQGAAPGRLRAVGGGVPDSTVLAGGVY